MTTIFDAFTRPGSTCSSCGSPIQWARMRSGRAMPCDPDAVEFWPGSGGRERFVVDGDVVAGERRQLSVLQGSPRRGLVPHWATCPSADEHRKTRT